MRVIYWRDAGLPFEVLTASVAKPAAERIRLSASRAGYFQLVAAPVAESRIRRILKVALRAVHVTHPL